ncbi:class I SAM-dependent RNA methyltransferase [Muricoccus radiodurans]|uniref:class I SAM-dependent RNA methyltransferase n=1 Tax=Muricoccus radiodurans TaxID=2231721 RepID=UPI003CE7206D
MTAPAAELTIRGMGAAGDGVAALPDGSPAFIPFTLPGETVQASITGRRGDGSAAMVDAILSASPDRVEPPCPHFGTCGGCALQHWAMPPQAAWKAGRVAEALARAGFPGVDVPPALTSPPNSRRRADFALRRTAGGIVVGFHARGAAEPFDMAVCYVIHPRLLGLVAPLRAMLAGLTALKRVGSAMVNLLDTGPDLLLRTDAPLSAADRARLADFGVAQEIPRIAWAPEGRGGEAEIAAGSGPVSVVLSGASVVPPPGAFLQATPQGEAAIIDGVLGGLGKRLPAKARIIELHAGLGTLSFALSARGRVEAYESSAPAVTALQAAAGRAGARIRATRRDLARQPLLPAELNGAAAVVLDPPFAGAVEQVGVLARAAVPRVIYVSCNPAALARDAALLARAPGWRVERVVAVDQFLWSSQVEAVVTFLRA